jgi:hypothetical protein
MTPDEVQRRANDAALQAVAHALTAAEREQFLAKTSRWPGMNGADVADILELTVDHDLYLEETEPFFEAHEADLPPDTQAKIYALHALIILDQLPTLSRVLKLLSRAGVLDTEHEVKVRDLITEEVADAMARAWDLEHCTEPNTPELSRRQALLLARHAMSRLHTIRERDHIDPLS